MKTYLVLLALFLLIVTIGCEQRIGGDTDEHGCLPAAGYQWCPSTQKCQRMWEEYCEEFRDQFRIRNFQDCVEAGYPIMESYPRQCMTDDGLSFNEQICLEGEKRYECGDYVKVVSALEGAGSKFYNGSEEISCPVVAPDSLSQECKNLLALECKEIC
ncbi:hypothetical protein KY337_04295 [Candidatus Woesearchaeota archaeon]|nr:hypothetical protein [Candidatus Woesearchaeota archaeon]